MQNLKGKIYKSPLAKTLIFAISVIGSGVLAGSYVNSITVNNKILWENSFKVAPTYFIIFYLILVYLYNRFLYITERNIEKFGDIDFCRNYLRSQYIPELAKRSKEAVRTGRMDELHEINNTFEGLIK